jgi:hypothetical protein
MTNYNIIYREPGGVMKFVIDDWFRFEYVRKEGDYGSLYLDLPPTYNMQDFAIDGRLEVWRQVGALPPYLDMDAVWFIRLVRSKVDENGKRLIHILAYDAVHLIERRIIPYASGTAQASKTGPADNVMKAIMRENFGNQATDASRDISDRLMIDYDLSKGATVTKEFAWRKCLPVMQELADESSAQGTYLTFDVVYVEDKKVMFKTYTGQRGTNRGVSAVGSGLIASIENGMLSYVSVSNDHTEERNFIYAGGRGEKENRIIATSYDLDRINISRYNRCEDWIDSRQTEENDNVQGDADNRLQEAKPKMVVNGHLQQVPGALYGVDYFFGDIITVKFGDMVFDVHLDTVHITVDGDGSEKVQIYSRNLDDTEY